MYELCGFLEIIFRIYKSFKRMRLFKTKNAVFCVYYSSYLLDLAPSDWFFFPKLNPPLKYRKFEL